MEKIKKIPHNCKKIPKQYLRYMKRQIKIEKWYDKWYLVPDYGNVVEIYACPWCYKKLKVK